MSAQQTPVPIPRLSAPVVLDGVPDDEAWSLVPALPLTMYAPTFGGTASQRSEVKVAHDDRFFYAVGTFYDDDPDGIRINSLYRDRWNGDDAFAIYIDGFNDNANAKWFGTTPGGIRFDILVSDDGNTLNESWDTFWDSRTRVTDEGWFAEVRIPFSSLGFQSDSAGRAVMGLTVTRLVSRTGERVTYPAIDPKFQFRQPSVAQDVILEDVESVAPLYVTPYALTGVHRTRGPLESGTYPARTDQVGEVGADVRYVVTENLTLDVTVNTDFAQVEADEEQVNLDRFPLFFPEKRRFFQERSGIFEFPSGEGSRLFHSRQIGLTPTREPLPVLGGTRLVGRVGQWDVGLLDMQTQDAGSISGENFGVLRLRRRVFNEYSTLGVLTTTRVGAGSHNVAVGVDGVFRISGDDYLTLKWAGSVDGNDGAGVGLFDRSHVYVNLRRRTNRGLAYEMSSTRSGRDFRPGLGFLPRRDFYTAKFLANWYFFPESSPRLRRIWPGALAFSTFRNGDNTLESGQYAVWMQWETRAGGGGWIEPKLFREDVVEPFRVGGVAEVPAGRYTFADLQLALSTSNGRKLRANADLRAGTYFDGTRAQAIVGPTWNVSPHLEIGGEYQYSRIRFGDRGTGADIHVGALRLRTALDARVSGNALVQYNSTTDRLDFNVRFRFNFSEGTDLWLVYNEALDTERTLEPSAVSLPPRTRGRSLILKYSHTFTR